jgi:hypothetical protein
MNAPAETHPLAAALGRRFSHRQRVAREKGDAEAFNLRTQNKRRNLNLDMIALMERGYGAKSPEVSAIRAELAKLPV